MFANVAVPRTQINGSLIAAADQGGGQPVLIIPDHMTCEATFSYKHQPLATPVDEEDPVLRGEDDYDNHRSVIQVISQLETLDGGADDTISRTWQFQNSGKNKHRLDPARSIQEGGGLGEEEDPYESVDRMERLSVSSDNSGEYQHDIDDTPPPVSQCDKYGDSGEDGANIRSVTFAENEDCQLRHKEAGDEVMMRGSSSTCRADSLRATRMQSTVAHLFDFLESGEVDADSDEEEGGGGVEEEAVRQSDAILELNSVLEGHEGHSSSEEEEEDVPEAASDKGTSGAGKERDSPSESRFSARESQLQRSGAGGRLRETGEVAVPGPGSSSTLESALLFSPVAKAKPAPTSDDKPQKVELRRSRQPSAAQTEGSDSEEEGGGLRKTAEVQMNAYRRNTWRLKPEEEERRAIDIDFDTPPAENGSDAAAVAKDGEKKKKKDTADATSGESSGYESQRSGGTSGSASPPPSSPSIVKAEVRRGVQRNDSTTQWRHETYYPLEHERIVTMTKEGKDQMFGFHILGDSPTVISTIDLDGLAASMGLHEGDVILSVNGLAVEGKTQQDIAGLIRRDLTVITLKVAQCTAPLSRAPNVVVYEGQLSKVEGRTRTRRLYWCVLLSDNVLYYYRKREDKEPVGAIMMAGYTVMRAADIHAKLGFRLTRYGSASHTFVAFDSQGLASWGNKLQRSSLSDSQDASMDVTSHNVDLPALNIRAWDNQGSLYKKGHKWKGWRKRYCVLKDACLYYYSSFKSEKAKGVVHFHGYIVKDTSLQSSSGKWTFTLLAPGDERSYYFYAETEMEKDRWMAAFEKSIGRWVKVDDEVFA